MDELIDRIRSLRDDLGRLEGALADSPASAALAFVDFDAEGTIVGLSPAAAMRLGVEVSAAIGRPLGALVDLQGEGDLVQCVIESGVRIPALRITSPDDGTGVLVIGHPAAQIVADGQRAPDKFLHDIANVLGVIRGHAELLAMELDDLRVARATDEIREAVARAQEMLQAQRGD